MKVVIQVAPEDDARAWGILIRHSPGIALPNRVVVISEEAVRALRDAGIQFKELTPAEQTAIAPGAPVRERV